MYLINDLAFEFAICVIYNWDRAKVDPKMTGQCSTQETVRENKQPQPLLTETDYEVTFN